MSDIKRAIQSLAKTYTGFDATIELATVIKVDEMNMTCDVVLFDNEDLVLEGVKLKPVVPELKRSEMGAVMFPEVNSKVLIAKINNQETDLFVVCFSKVKKISLDAGSLFTMLLDVNNGNLNLNAAKMIFNNGSNGGIPKTRPIVNKLNQLERTVNDLIKAFNNHVHTGVSAGASSTAPIVTKATDIKDLTLVDDIENKDIQQ